MRTSLSTLLRLNAAYLEQARSFVADLSAGCYVATQPPVYRSGVGEHLRHILEHYQSLLDGLPTGRIDYDGRARDQRVSSDRDAALVMIDSLLERLREVRADDCDVVVRLEADPHPDAVEDGWSKSTLKREMQYLQAHTVHHYALIAVILRLQGYEPPADFGVAPSTLRSRQIADS